MRRTSIWSSGPPSTALLNEFRAIARPGEKKLTTRALEELTDGEVEYRVVPRRALSNYRASFAGSRILLGVTGGIASYKSVWLARWLTQRGVRSTSS